jgi:hypothetical protein
MYELVAIHYFNKPLPNHKYELVAIHYSNKPLPNHMYELVAIHYFNKTTSKPQVWVGSDPLL